MPLKAMVIRQCACDYSITDDCDVNIMETQWSVILKYISIKKIICCTRCYQITCSAHLTHSPDILLYLCRYCKREMRESL